MEDSLHMNFEYLWDYTLQIMNKRKQKFCILFDKPLKPALVQCLRLRIGLGLVSIFVLE